MAKTIYVDAKFDTEERRLIRDGAYNWTFVSNQRIIYNVVFDYKVPATIDEVENKIVVVDLDANDQLTKTFDDVSNGGIFLSGYMKKPKAEFLFLCAERMDTETFGRAIQRELGEEMGLTLIVDYGIMNEARDSYTNCPSLYDMREFCNYFLCNIEEVRYCLNAP